METQTKDLIDVYIKGMLFEIIRELNMEYEDKLISDIIIGAKVEDSVLLAMKHECLLEYSPLTDYVKRNRMLTKWYETNANRYSDIFVDILAPRIENIRNLDKQANIWGNLTSQMIGAIVGNIREDGL